MQSLGPFGVQGWSIAGNETCVAVYKDNLRVAFDMGICMRSATRCDFVFISHGHIDHVGAIAQHMRKRHLNNLAPATYYMPPEFIEPVKNICSQFGILHGNSPDYLRCPIIIAIQPEDRLEVAPHWSVEAFKTDHTDTSQGYILFCDGVPEIAYLGDTSFTVFRKPPHTELLKVKLLITEATYLDNPRANFKKAAEYNHTYLGQFQESANLFEEVQFIYLIHFSDRYSTSAIRRCMTILPPWLQSKIRLCLTAKASYELPAIE